MATSLLTEKVMASGSWRKSKSDSTATMRGVILSPATMCLNPKPASHTGTSTWECPQRGGTQRRTSRTAGGASLPRGTPTTPTSGRAAVHRETRRRATVLSALIATNWLSPPFTPREGPPYLKATLDLSRLLTAPRDSIHVVRLGRHPVGPAQIAEEGPWPRVCRRPRGPFRLTDEWIHHIRKTATMTPGKGVAKNRGARLELQTSTV